MQTTIFGWKTINNRHDNEVSGHKVLSRSTTNDYSKNEFVTHRLVGLLKQEEDAQAILGVVPAIHNFPWWLGARSKNRR